MGAVWLGGDIPLQSQDGPRGRGAWLSEGLALPGLPWPAAVRPCNLGWAELRAQFTSVWGAVGTSRLLFLELRAFFSLQGLLISERWWIRNRGKSPFVVLALEIIEPFFTHGQSNSVHIWMFFLKNQCGDAVGSHGIHNRVQSFSVIVGILCSLANRLLVVS